MPLTAAKGAKKKADDIFSKLIRSKGYCQGCGSTQNLQTCHIISRRYNHTRTDLTNAVCGCAACHRRWTDNPTEFGLFVLELLGERGFYELNARSQNRGKFDWEAELERLKPLLAAVEAR